LISLLADSLSPCPRSADLLLICRATAVTTTTVPLAPDATAASLLLDRHPPAVARHLDLQRESSSSRWARLFVVSAGADWQRDLIRDAAAFAAGPSTRLAIADHDHDHDLARPLRPAAESQRGHRLFSVAALSLHWGSAGAGREMRVGVAAPCRRGDLLAHRARPARDAMRTVLAYGANSSDPGSAAGRSPGHGNGRLSCRNV
jgi:hypothetical protein